MSRSALWRQEAGVKEREIHAQEVFQTAVEEGRNVRTKGLVPLYGPDDSFHIHPMLFSCIVKAPYFTKCCNELKDWNALVDEIYYEVKHVEPWAAGGKCGTVRNLLCWKV
jgi:pre-mRNA-splicing factor 38B